MNADRWYTARMATKRNQKKQTKRTVGRKATTMKKALKKMSTREVIQEEAAKRRHLRKRGATKKQVRGKSQIVDTVAFAPVGLERGPAGNQEIAGIVQRRRCGFGERDELLQEGNAFEAEVVKGVEDAGDADEGKFARMRCRRTMFLVSIG